MSSSMPYFNSATIIASLAIVPELSLTNEGRRYCNFAVQAVYRLPNGTPCKDYINITSYDDDAEMVVRDCKVGDYLLSSGYLAMQHWKQEGKHRSKLVFVADTVQLIARGNGQLPDVDKLKPESLPFRPYRTSGETQYISSISMDRHRPEKINPDRNRFPQPMPDGTWKIPIGGGGKVAQKFMANNPDVPENGKSYINPMNDADYQEAQKIIPENLPVRYVKGKRVVFMPDGHYIPEKGYANLVDGQRKRLLAMDDARRNRVFEIAMNVFGVSVDANGMLPFTPPLNCDMEEDRREEFDRANSCGDN